MTMTVVALVFALRAMIRGEQPIEQQIGKQLYADKSCYIRVSTNDVVARRWPAAAEAKLISCDTSENAPFPHHLMDYAQYPSTAALSEWLEAASPDGPYCTLQSAVVVLVLNDLTTEFAAMCAERGGSLHG
jgi:hypothetical protein